MGLLGNGAVGHRTRLKSLYNVLYTFYLIDGDTLFRIIKLQKTP